MGILTIKTLISGGLLQRAEVTNKGPDFDIVEVLFGDKGRDDGLAAVPRHLELRMLLVDILSQEVDTLRVVVATHEGDTGDVLTVLLDVYDVTMT